MIPSIEVIGVVDQIKTIVEYAGLSDDEEVSEIVTEIEESVLELSEVLEEKE